MCKSDINIGHQIMRRKVLLEQILQNAEFMDDILNLYQTILECIIRGNKVIFCGNGGSAADCQHIVAELMVKLTKLREALPAISLTCNTSVITAITNDIDANHIFVRQIEGIANAKDVLVGISTSGNSANIIKAIEYANKHRLYTVLVTGNTENKGRELAQFTLRVPSDNTQIIQEIYLIIFHIICEKIEVFFDRHAECNLL